MLERMILITYTYTHTYIHARARTHAHACTRTRARMHTHAQERARCPTQLWPGLVDGPHSWVGHRALSQLGKVLKATGTRLA